MPHVGIFAEQKGLVSQTERNALNMRERERTLFECIELNWWNKHVE